MNSMVTQNSDLLQAIGQNLDCPVHVDNEWDSLQEVIVGTIETARYPTWHVSVEAPLPRKSHPEFIRKQGQLFDAELLDRARREVDGLAEFLQRLGVKVRRPNFSGLDSPFVTPMFSSRGGLYSAMPRDGLFAVGNSILETPMAWRDRYFESFAYRDILMDYFKRGARWRAAPKPQLSDALYRQDYDSSVEHFDSVLTEAEPVFDAADFVRIGPDIIGQYSHVTNRTGAQWLARELGPDYKVHMYNFDDAGPMHIDTTLLPIAPGRVLVNKSWVSRLPDFFKDWEILTPPPSTLPDSHPLPFTSRWISVNILMLDAHHVLVEESETPLIEAFKSWKIEAIPIPFKHFQTFGGSFHCATLDVRRGASSAPI
ncbi:amidinotransferase [Xenorhabdus budapestensis]|uniref:Putative L-arginine:lysine amidinotransferase n=1 Tax=Xenorhabdus budapestensis TaxID=290110 RepID=A0A2D0IUE2_XENBU|nr:amidinotransferase [Xenorhabdus budapestensis]PHM25433.1 putative L-arginine:lysine amidinotransferase [Xenorhabdus budapestensis]